jgi:hypothetical protein
MSRLLCFTTLLAGITALASSPSAAPPKPTKADKPAAGVPQHPVRALVQTVSFAGADDPKATVKDVLDQLAKRHDFAYTFNEKAFKYEMLNDVVKTEVANPSPLPPMRASLARVLAHVLSRIAVPSGATFLVREEGIEITTGQFQEAEIHTKRPQVEERRPDALTQLAGAILLSRLAGMSGGGLGGVAGIGGLGGFGFGFGPMDPLDDELKKIHVPVVSIALEKQPLEEAFRQCRAQVNVNLVLDPALGEKARTPTTITLLNAPADSALLVLAEMAELDYVWLDNIFFVTTPDKAKKLKSKWPNRRSGGGTLNITGAGAAGM